MAKPNRAKHQYKIKASTSKASKRTRGTPLVRVKG